jgi:hypothetical protein
MRRAVRMRVSEGIPRLSKATDKSNMETLAGYSRV